MTDRVIVEYVFTLESGDVVAGTLTSSDIDELGWRAMRKWIQPPEGLKNLHRSWTTPDKPVTLTATVEAGQEHVLDALGVKRQPANSGGR